MFSWAIYYGEFGVISYGVGGSGIMLTMMMAFGHLSRLGIYITTLGDRDCRSLGVLMIGGNDASKAGR